MTFMKLLTAFAGIIALAGSLFAKEPDSRRSAPKSVPGPYPAIIQMPPADPAGQPPPKGLIQSELGGREMQFLRDAIRASREQIALARLAADKASSDQVMIVAETIGSAEATEHKELARLAEARHVTVEASPVKFDALSALTGAKFEKAWIERLIEVSSASAAAYELGAGAQDPEIRNFAGKMLPVAKARLQVASRLGGLPVAPSAGRARPIAPPVEPPAPSKAPVPPKPQPK